MKITYDPNKNERNISERGLSFDEVIDFDWRTADVWRDERKPYPEPRYGAFGYLGERLHHLCFTPTNDGIRVISFRKANKREVKKYEQRQAQHHP